MVVRCLTAEAVERAALPLERVDDVEGGDGLALGVLGVGDSITDDALEEGLKDTTGLFVDHCEAVRDGPMTYQIKGTYWQRYA